MKPFYKPDPEPVEREFDVGHDPLDALENPPGGRVYGYTHRPGAINVDTHIVSPPAVSMPENPTVAAALAWLRETFRGRRFAFRDVPTSIARAAGSRVNRPVDGLLLWHAGVDRGVRRYRVARVAEVTGDPRDWFEAVTDTGFVAFGHDRDELIARAAALPGDRLTLRGRGNRKVVGVYRRTAAGRWWRSRATPAIEPVALA